MGEGHVQVHPQQANESQFASFLATVVFYEIAISLTAVMSENACFHQSTLTAGLPVEIR
jgi:hypothetical protein